MSKYIALAIAAIIAVPAYCAPVAATEYWDWAMADGNPTTRNKHARTRSKYARRYRKINTETASSASSQTKVMAYVKRDGEKDIAVERHQFTCAEKVRGLGTQWIGTEGAMDAAKKDWMERVRYDYGESFLDMGNAKDFISRCSRVSIGETLGQVMYRCEIVARPCKGTMNDTTTATAK
ncbi:MAG: hypothetical protein Q8K85_06585 [Hyphomicrobium sp.]|nr:hypothetical protein [Hyphomicrobium sp.]